jgi:very-short-patch-repair endonuclease
VTTTRRGCRPKPGIDVQHVRAFAPDDITTLRGIPITSVARTLGDLATVVSPDGLERAIHEAEVLRLLDARAVREATRGRPGAAAARAVLAEPSPSSTRAALEERFLALCRRGGLPLPRTNVHVQVGDGLVEVDALWPRERLVVELDGAAAHHTARGFEDDRRRDAAMTACGYVVVRLTWRRVTREGSAVVEELRRMLALRGAAAAP